MASVCPAPRPSSSRTSLLPQLSALFTLVLEANLFPPLGKHQTKSRCVVPARNGPCWPRISLDPTPSKGLLNALPLLEAHRMLILAKKICSRNQRESPERRHRGSFGPTVVPWLQRMAVSLYSLQCFAGFTNEGDQTCWMPQDIPGVYCHHSLIFNRIPF